MGLSLQIQKDSRTFRATAIFFKSHSALMMLGNRYQEGTVTLLPDSPSAWLPPQQSSASPSFPSPAFHSTPVPRPGLWEDSEGTGSGLAFRLSRNHKVGQRQKQFLGSPQKTRCDEAAVNTSDFNSSATGMKLKNATQIGGATQNCDLCT